MDYEEVKAAVESERELMRFMLDLSPSQWSDLMNVSKAMADLRKAELQAEMAKNQAKRDHELKMDAQKRREDVLKNQEQQKTLRERQAQEARLKELREQEEREKRLIDYRVQKEVESEAEKTRQRILAEQGVNKLVDERIEREKQFMIDQERLRSQLQMEREKELAPMKLKQEIELHHAKKDWLLKRDVELEKLRGQQAVELTRAKFEGVLKFLEGEDGKKRLTNLAIFGSSLITVFFAGKAIYPVVKRALKDYLFKPTLVSESERQTWYFMRRRRGQQDISHAPAVFNEEMQSKLDQIVNAVTNTHKHKGFYAHLLLSGAPGTGKTLWARHLARRSGMDFALMSGSAFDAFKPSEAIQEIGSLFRWARSSRRGLILFIDEADSFLESRKMMSSSEKVRVLNEWISQTGTETSKFCCVYATNRPEVLDMAVLSRVTRTIEFPIPGVREIRKMLQHFMRIILETGARVDTSAVHLDALAHKLHVAGFVGRDVCNYVIAMQQAVYGGGGKLTEEMADKCLDEQILKKKREMDFQSLQDEAFQRSTGVRTKH